MDPTKGIKFCSNCGGGTDLLPRKEVISIQPGDVIAVHLVRSLSLQGISNLKAALKPAFPDNKIIVLDEGMTLEVYREQGKLVDVTGLDGKKTFKKVGEQVKDET